MTKTLLVATHNPGKVTEYAGLLSDLDINWRSLDDIGVTEEVDETGLTFLANAKLKASAYAQAAGLLTLADDSGLEVDALGGAPGIKTARFGGPGLSSEERYRFLLAKMQGIPLPDRQARFVCVIALAGADGHILATATGTIDGFIALQPEGKGGFGYDPIFMPAGWQKTFAELDLEEKNKISHRAIAVEKLAEFLNSRK